MPAGHHRVPALTLALLAPAAPADQGSDQEEPNEPEMPIFGTYLGLNPLPLVPGSVAFELSAPGYAPVAFHQEVAPLAGYPGSLWFPDSPFGAGALLLEPSPGGCDYYLGFASTGVLVPLTWGTDHHTYAGDSGPLHCTVAQDPIAGGPGWRWLPGEHEGETIIEFVEAGDAFFVQFFTMKVTWEGFDANGAATGGNGTGTVSWEGTDVKIDGSTVYVDSTRPDGEYGGVTGTRDGSTYMQDAPNLLDPQALGNHIEGQPGNTGVRVTKVTVEWHYTTYVGIRLVAGGQQITKKYEWTIKEVVNVETATSPHHPNGHYGGRGGAPGPVASPASNLDPQHFQAMGPYLYGSNSGAPANGGW